FRRLFKIVIRAYQYLVSPWLPPACRFTPTCSQYALEALDRLPLARALGRIIRRLAKCHPFHEGGHDPVQ
ncbi:MAG: membrane protein insertion efficiency factor YidD, partial [Nitrospinaceae bacterium]